ncbi:LOW QUALITY PROTEIN: hypothetical protein RTBOTA2_004674 [Rhodotorula toruloides]|nr:LOW QUALITY PROTEIN: hypothetical protein RTBOTA2_004674 [Rhodotorula toruloides]
MLALRRLSGTAKTIRRELRQLSKAGAGTDKALASLEAFVDELDSLAGLAPTTPKPTTPKRPATSTKVSEAPIVDNPAPKPTCSDASTPPPDPPLTARLLREVLQTEMQPVYARLRHRGAAAAVLPPTPPPSPPRPADDNNDPANALFAEVLARPAPTPSWPRPAPIPARPAPAAIEPKTTASHLVHLYAQPDLTLPKARSALGIPATIPMRQTKKGDGIPPHQRPWQQSSLQLNPPTPTHTLNSGRSASMPLAGQAQTALRRVGAQIRTLQAALSELESKGVGCPTLLRAMTVLRDEYESLAAAAPTTPRPAATTRTTAPTPAKNALISSTTTSKPTCDDATTPPAPPALTLEAVDERIEAQVQPLRTELESLKASLSAAAATPPTPPTTPPQPLEANYEAANRPFAEVAAIPPLSTPWPRPSTKATRRQAD